MLMGIIDQGGAGVRSGRAGDAGRIVKRRRRRADRGQCEKCGLAQALENAVLPISITPTSFKHR